MSDRPIDVLVVEDSRVTRMFLVHLLGSDPQIRVVGAVGDGQAALDFLRDQRPDVVLMDIHMPGMGGFEATRRIMEVRPVPIVICTASSDPRDTVVAFQAMEAGAIACVGKPLGSDHADFEAVAAHLLETVRLMSEVKVVRRLARSRSAPSPPLPRGPGAPAEIRVVGIGASTGGPQVLQTILAALPKNFSTPVLIVQHMAHGFLAGMVEWLDQTTGLRIHVASHGIEALPGHVYIAPDDLHMGVDRGGRIVLTREEPENHLRPAVAHLFRSLAREYGAHGLGILLTGMGKDGAVELKLMKDRGAVTIVQDRDSSTVYGMPGAAVELGAATHVVPAERIADAMVALVNGAKPRPGG
ncbi:MAG: chemotaxis-specific protein-glutamate methyltransferase CheB [Nevskiaceae bacterium]